MLAVFLDLSSALLHLVSLGFSHFYFLETEVINLGSGGLKIFNLCLSVHVYCGALGVQMRASDLLEQELQAAVSHPVGGLEAQLQLSEGTTS